jgi:hypothetical protein
MLLIPHRRPEPRLIYGPGPRSGAAAIMLRMGGNFIGPQYRVKDLKYKTGFGEYNIPLDFLDPRAYK